MHAVLCVKCGEKINIHTYLAETGGLEPPSCEPCRKDVRFEAHFRNPIWPKDWHGGARLDKWGAWIVEILLNVWDGIEHENDDPDPHGDNAKEARLRESGAAFYNPVDRQS